MSEYIKVLLLAAAPVSELRGAIPAALLLFQFSPLQAYLTAVIGNLVPVPVLLYTLPKIEHLLTERIVIVRDVTKWLFARTKDRHHKKFARWKEFALILLVAIPLPLTGAWTGALAAFLFGIPFLRAFGMIAVGVFVAGAIVTASIAGAINLTGVDL